MIGVEDEGECAIFVSFTLYCKSKLKGRTVSNLAKATAMRINANLEPSSQSRTPPSFQNTSELWKTPQ